VFSAGKMEGDGGRTDQGPEIAPLKGDGISTVSPLPPGPPEQLSGVAVVIIIAVGVQTIIMLFIFAKRQVMRFALRSRRGPHVSVGQGSMKQLRREIDRRLDYVNYVTHEPQLRKPGCQDGPHNHRLQLLDKIAELDIVIARYDSAFCRPPGAPLRSFLTECLAGPLVGLDPKLLHRFCDLYEHARHSYRAFGEVELQNFNNLFVELRTLVASNSADKPGPVKKAVTPQHRKALNRPRRRLVQSDRADRQDVGAGQQLLQHRNSTAVLISTDTSAPSTDSTPV